MTQQGKRLGKLQEISNEIASQRLMREEIVRENLAKEKRKSAWLALQSLAKDHELAQRLKEKR